MTSAPEQFHDHDAAGELCRLTVVEFDRQVNLDPTGTRTTLVLALGRVESLLATRKMEWKNTREQRLLSYQDWLDYSHTYRAWTVSALRFRSVVNERLARIKATVNDQVAERNDLRVMLRYLTRGIIACAADELTMDELLEVLDALTLPHRTQRITLADADRLPWHNDERAQIERIMRASPASAAHRGTKSYRPVPIGVNQ